MLPASFSYFLRASAAACDFFLYFVHLQKGDAILLCTDGLIDTVLEEEMEREILLAGDEHGCLNRLLDIAKSRGASDNVTAVLLRQC